MFYTDDIKDKKILLHACCGPCSLGAIEPLLSGGALITLFYYNPCIIDGEFEKRLEALGTVAKHYRLPLVVKRDGRDGFIGYAKDYAADREGGERCRLCMDDRLSASARYAADNGFDTFSTTLTVSPHKNSKLIFSLADSLSENVGVPFLARDFKKNDGFKKSCELSRELNIYRQGFCGCEYSCASAGIDVSEYSAKVKSEYPACAASEGRAW
ncbi:MAG: epoxyqueuosine reductase QueH [Clostridiales bacterium]|nr:epoxyqueuosine reductase QueH [Clostridiales bacterium]